MNKYAVIAVLSLSSSLVCASQVRVSGQVDVEINPRTLSGEIQSLQFTLPTYELSPSAKAYLHDQLAQYPKNAVANFASPTNLPKKVDLGMLMTPVLDQGRHGSCVTFAVSAAIDAALGAGDYISQLCNLELGSYLESQGKAEYSGWDGSFANKVLGQISQYGVLSQNYQKSQGCAGVFEYPRADSEDKGKLMSEKDFMQNSIPVAKAVGWKDILNPENAFSDYADRANLVNHIKEELVKGNRLTVGLLLDVEPHSVGADGTYHEPNDTWMLNPRVLIDALTGNINAGHELVIVGYDDDAVVTDKDGIPNTGLFTLRNSWSKAAGDKGNYYVSYDYMQFLGLEVNAISVKSKS